MEALTDIITKVGFDWRLALANFVNFLIVFWVLKRFFFEPLRDLSSKRIALLAKQVVDADTAANEKAKAGAYHEHAIYEAKNEAESIITTAREQSKMLEERAKVKILELRNETIKKARDDIEREKKELRTQARKEAGSLVAYGMKTVFDQTLSTAQTELITKKLATGK
ncbi:MAG: ATP synthase F0 subunit B [bacterium]|nr:ATP synthase F0 subunit B [bacterium]